MSTKPDQYRKPPPPGIRRLIWTWWVKLEATFVFAMLEPWEKALLLSIFGFITFFFWWSVITYYPSHLAYLSRRFSYYVWGDESIDAGGVFREWLKDQLWRAWEGGKGLVGGGGTGSKVEL